MKRRPLHYISAEKELELINRLITVVDNREFHPSNTAIIQASVDYAGIPAIHLAHAWSVQGEIIPIIPIEVTYPDESYDYVISKFRYDMKWHLMHKPYERFVVVESGIIRGGNWKWIVDEFDRLGFTRSQVTLITLCENVHSIIKSDYVAEYYDDQQQDLTFHFERYNKHWPTI